jgi:hypothetical protein
MITVRRLTCVFACLMLAACQGMRDQMDDVLQLVSALHSQFHVPATVNVTGGDLTVSIAGQAADKLSAADRNALALTVARFAYAHYGHRDALSRVTVTFVFRTTSGAITYSRTEPGGSWPASELDTKSSADPLASLTPRAFEDTLLVTAMDSGSEGTQERSLRPMPAGQGRALWELVVTYRRRPPAVTSVDSLRIDRTTFYPVGERRHNAKGLTRLVYDGAHVHGVVDSGTTMRAVDTTFDIAPFASSQLDVIIRALPLAPAFATTLPVYYPSYGGVIQTTVRVVSADTAMWTIEASNGPGTAQRFRVARPSRLLIDIRDATDSVHGTSYVRR